MLSSKGKEIYVGQLSGAMNPVRLKNFQISNAYVVMPKLMIIERSEFDETIYRFGW